MTAVTVRVPAKVNLQLSVGPTREDGYHELVNVFHAVSLFDEVTVTAAEPHAQRGFVRLSSDATPDAHASCVPLDDSNLAAHAVRRMARETPHAGPVDVHLRKRIPIAGGMAGGSADAAGALVACDTLWKVGLTPGDHRALAAEIGSDVAFPLVGRTAVGTGRGEHLTPVADSGHYHWVFALSRAGLSTADVYAEYDRARPDAPAPHVDAALMAALAAGDARRLAAALVNDLQPAALSLRPDLAGTLAVGRAAGALAAIVSGSGPTCAFLAPGDAGARTVAAELQRSGHCERAVRAHGPVDGATVVPSATR